MPLDEENRREIDKAKREPARQPVGDQLSAYLKKKADDIESADREKRLNLCRQQIKAHKYMDGNFFGYVNANAEWVDVRKEEGEVWYQDNQIYQYARTSLMEMSRSQTEVVVTAFSQSEEMQALAKFAKTRVDANRERMLNAQTKQTENSYAFFNGITFRYTYFDFNTPGQRKEKIPRYAKQDAKPGEKVKICVNCHRTQPNTADAAKDILGAEYIDNQKCRCGSSEFIEREGFSDEPDTIIGYDEVPRGRNKVVIPNPVGVIVSLQASKMSESPFAMWKQLIVRAVLEEKYDGIRLPSTGTSTELRYITSQQVATPGEGGGLFEAGETGTGLYTSVDTDRNELELLELRQVWLDYAVYCRKTFDQDMRLSNGKVLRAGEALGTMFKKGLYFALVGDMVLDMWNEDKNRKWTSSPYGIRAGSMYGTGATILLADQELLNDLMRLKMANAWYNGVPREFVDKNLIPELSVDPAIPTNVNPIGENRRIVGTAYDVAPALPLSGEIYALSADRRDSIQGKTGAMSGQGGGGMADAQKWGDTATAISIKRDLAVGRFSPDLQLMADNLDCEQAYQILENEQEFYTDAQLAELAGDTGKDVIAAFRKINIREDLNITTAPGSHMPKSDAQVQSQIMALAQVLPLIMPLGNQELVAHAFEAFGLPERLGAWTSDRAQAQRIVQRYRLLCDEAINQVGDAPSTDLNDPRINQAVAAIAEYANAPIDVFLDNHAALSEAYRDLRASDEGREWSNLLTACIAQRVLEHQAGIAIQQQLVARRAQVAQAPIKEEVEADHAKQLEADNAAAEQARADAAEQQQAGMVDKMVEYNDKDQERELKREMKAAEILANSEPQPATSPPAA